MTFNSDDIVQNRSELVFLYDARDANPNGNPLTGSDRPRIDAQTQQAVVTDVRLKRYLRDQLQADGHGVFVSSVGDEEGNALSREQLLEAVMNAESAEEIDGSLLHAFLDTAVDVRYFGATLSVDGADSDLVEAFRENVPRHMKGALQFSPARSLNAVQSNDESKKLTSVISSDADNKQGTMADDHRIKYALIPFHGVVDEAVAASDTKLSEDDVVRLDTLCWRAIKNQANSRSKRGQEPRLYVRVEYADDRFHVGDIHTVLEIDEEHSKPDREMRTVRDVCLDIDEFVALLDRHAERIDTVHVAVDEFLRVSTKRDGERVEGDRELLFEALEVAVGEDTVRRIDVYEEHAETLPGAGEAEAD